MYDTVLFQLREYAKELRSAVAQGADKEALQQILNRQMTTIFRIIGICLGTPPSSFTWEHYQNKNNYASIGPITPLEFYEQHVRPLFDVKEKVTCQSMHFCALIFVLLSIYTIKICWDFSRFVWSPTPEKQVHTTTFTTCSF